MKYSLSSTRRKLVACFCIRNILINVVFIAVILLPFKLSDLRLPLVIMFNSINLGNMCKKILCSTATDEVNNIHNQFIFIIFNIFNNQPLSSLVSLP